MPIEQIAHTDRESELVISRAGFDWNQFCETQERFLSVVCRKIRWAIEVGSVDDKIFDRPSCFIAQVAEPLICSSISRSIAGKSLKSTKADWE
jgi:hypothetical protein